MTGTTATPVELLTDCNAHGIRLTLSDGHGLEIDAPQGALTPELLARLKAYKTELLALLASGPQDTHGDAGQALAAVAAPRRRSAVPVAVEWPAAAADFCLLLTPDDLPPVPFKLNAWTEVRDAGKRLRWLRADILRGPNGPRAFYGALQRDLQDLQRFVLAAVENEPQNYHRIDADGAT